MFVDEIVDLVQIADLYSEPQGILRLLGRCWNDTETFTPQKEDWAYRYVPLISYIIFINHVYYRWSNQARVTLQTNLVFPDRFPSDFSILIVAKPQPGKLLTEKLN